MNLWMNAVLSVVRLQCREDDKRKRFFLKSKLITCSLNSQVIYYCVSAQRGQISYLYIQFNCLLNLYVLFLSSSELNYICFLFVKKITWNHNDYRLRSCSSTKKGKTYQSNIQISTESNDGCNLGTYRFWVSWRNESCTVPVSLLPLKNLVRTTLILSA
jgi:hypothetical protein